MTMTFGSATLLMCTSHEHKSFNFSGRGGGGGGHVTVQMMSEPEQFVTNFPE